MLAIVFLPQPRENKGIYLRGTKDMKIIRIATGLVVLALLVAQLAWNGSEESTGISQNDRADFNPNEAPKEAIQRVWRTGDNTVFLQYTYSAPNQCWQNGNTQSLTLQDDMAVLTIVPSIKEAICAQVLTALTYDQAIEIKKEIEVLAVVVEHPEGGQIERNELWIEPNE